MMTKIFGLVLVAATLTGPANAAVDQLAHFDLHQFRGDYHEKDVPRMTAPEIDPASAMSAFTMMAGALVVLRGRRNKK